MGVVDYDGQTQARVSAKTDVDYFGVNAEVVGGLHPKDGLQMNLLGGLGVDTWTRELQDGVTANGSVALGYDELGAGNGQTAFRCKFLLRQLPLQRLGIKDGLGGRRLL